MSDKELCQDKDEVPMVDCQHSKLPWKSETCSEAYSHHARQYCQPLLSTKAPSSSPSSVMQVTYDQYPSSRKAKSQSTMNFRLFGPSSNLGPHHIRGHKSTLHTKDSRGAIRGLNQNVSGLSPCGNQSPRDDGSSLNKTSHHCASF